MTNRSVQIDVNAGHAPSPSRPPLSPEEIAKRRAAELGSMVATGLALSCCVLAFVVFCCLFVVSVSLSSDWGWTLGLILISGCLTVWGLVIPAITTLMQHSYPREARIAMVVWFWVMGGAFLGIASSTLRADTSESAWAPREWLPSVNVSQRISRASSISEEAITQMIILLLCAGLLPAAGIGLRWSVLARAESYRLAYGDLPLGPAPIAQQPRMEAISMHTPGDIYSAWLDSRIRPAQGMEVGATRLYADYSATCDLCGIERMSQKAFGDKLTHFVEQSQGRYLKAKGSDGKTVYRGLALAEDSLPLYEMPQPERIEGLR